MKLISSEKKEKSTVELVIEVSAEEFEAACAAAYAKQRGRITLPGFRKGKAPRKMIERMYGENFFWEDAVNESYGSAYDAALKEAGIEAVGEAKMEVEKIDKDGYTFKALVPVKPEITVSDYKGIEAPLYPVSVGEDEANDELERMLKRNARIETVDRAIAGGDTAVIDFEGFTDGVAFEGGKGENYSLEIGSQSFIPGFEEQLVGRKAGDECEVHVTFPDEYHAEELAGKPAVFKVKIHEVKESILPTLDDEFAKDVSEFDTLAELKADIEKRIRESREASVKSSFENAVMDKLAQKVEGEIPDAMIDAQAERQLENMAYRLQSQGMDFQTYVKLTGMTVDDMRADMRPRAEVQVKVSLALEKIAEIEKVEVTQEDIDAEYNKFAEQYNMPLEQVKIAVNEDDLRGDLLREKASKIVLDAAKGIDPDVAAEKEKKPAAKKSASTKTSTKTAAEKKPAAKKTAAKSTEKTEKAESTEEKPKTAKKPAAKKPAAKSEEKAETAEKKSAAKKTTAKSTTAKTSTAKKTTKKTEEK